jgi:hypothetical protein
MGDEGEGAVNTLKGRGAGRPAASRLCNPVRQNTVAHNTYTVRPEIPALQAFGGLASERLDPIPSMFRTKERPLVQEAPESRSSLLSILTGVSPYLAAIVLCVLVSGFAVHVSTAKPAEDDAVKPAPATRTEAKNRSAVAGAATPAPVERKASEAKRPEPAKNDAWSQTVETYKQLLAQQPAPETPKTKQADGEQFMRQLETWMNKAR